MNEHLKNAIMLLSQVCVSGENLDRIFVAKQEIMKAIKNKEDENDG